jgi:hypothetical protein
MEGYLVGERKGKGGGGMKGGRERRKDSRHTHHQQWWLSGEPSGVQRNSQARGDE